MCFFFQFEKPTSSKMISKEFVKIFEGIEHAHDGQNSSRKIL